MKQENPIAEAEDFIILKHYERKWKKATHYQSENELEKEFIHDLQQLGYEPATHIKDPEALLINARTQIEALNNVHFSPNEWERFVNEYLNKPNEGHIERTQKVHNNYIYDFTFDNGRIQNIYLFDKKNLARNKLQVIQQFEQQGKHENRYDVTILINGLPMVHIELKRRGKALREAFNQIHRYQKESMNGAESLFKYVQIFVISNGTNTRYFANTTKRDKNSYDFTMNWALENNEQIKDLKDVTETFFQKNTLLKVLFRYSIMDVENRLLIMRPYQIAATERIIWKIKSSYNAKNWNNPTSGGYIWHSTGSGKTLTSFKAACLTQELDCIDKVLFVVDRKDLDYQTIKEYQRFSPDSVNGSKDTKALEENLAKKDNKIVVTTIQKLNNLMKTRDNLDIYQKNVVFIFDECHRSQFGEAQSNLHKKFKKFIQFGFTGTPIFKENAIDNQTTQKIFGEKLHTYCLPDALEDQKVLKFHVEYHNVQPRFKDVETEQDETIFTTQQYNQLLLHPQRITEVTQYILDNFNRKTHRCRDNTKGFNALFAVSSVEAAKAYYSEFKKLQEGKENPLTVATIFSFTQNEAQEGFSEEESFDTTRMEQSSKEFLESAIKDYNKQFSSNFSINGGEFQNYYRDLSKRVRDREVDLLIVVGMFLTGFDAPTLNTLFVDKNLRYHGLIQAFSRTNRIYDATKACGNIVCFRNLEEATKSAITLFGNGREGENRKLENLVLEKGYAYYMYGEKAQNGEKPQKSFITILEELNQHFPNPEDITTDEEKIKFVKLFGEYLRTEIKLQNYDSYTCLKALQTIDPTNTEELEALKNKYCLEEHAFQKLRAITLPNERTIQNYTSVYHDIQEEVSRNKNNESFEPAWSEIVFERELLNSHLINIDYIFQCILEHVKKSKDKVALIETVRTMIRASTGRAKEDLIVDFINKTNFEDIKDKPALIESFMNFANEVQKREIETLIEEENLKPEQTKRYVKTSLQQGFASENGTDLHELLPAVSPLDPTYLSKRYIVFEKLKNLVKKFETISWEEDNDI